MVFMQATNIEVYTWITNNFEADEANINFREVTVKSQRHNDTRNISNIEARMQVIHHVEACVQATQHVQVCVQTTCNIEVHL